MTEIEAGRHRKLPLRVVKEAVIRQVAHLTGLDVLDLIQRADLFFYDSTGRQVTLDSVMVSWTE